MPPQYPTRFIIKATHICDKRHGKKVIASPIWDDFWKWYASLNQEPGKDKENLWWLELGATPETYPEEIDCPECDGAGEIVHEVDLQVALASLADTR